MKAVIGICLGSQMIASALGQNVYKNNDKEIGWYPVMLTDEGENSGLLTKAWNNNVFFHWHGETFDLPDGAVHMAFSKACRNQAFHIHGRVFGFQFHPETNTQTLNQMISAGGDELVKGKYVMNAGEILDQQHYLLHCKELMFYFLSRLANSSNLLG
jgi:GMP synthase (glutamine-hydrolysing)